MPINYHMVRTQGLTEKLKSRIAFLEKQNFLKLLLPNVLG